LPVKGFKVVRKYGLKIIVADAKRRKMAGK
jgi:hypothetical protein